MTDLRNFTSGGIATTMSCHGSCIVQTKNNNDDKNKIWKQIVVRHLHTGLCFFSKKSKETRLNTVFLVNQGLRACVRSCSVGDGV